MKKTIFAAVMLAAFLAASAPGLAQEEEPTANKQSALAENAPEPPDSLSKRMGIPSSVATL